MEDTASNTIFGDLANVEKTLSEDGSGEQARAMLAYFEDASKSTQELIKNAADDTERKFLAGLVDGFGAAQRIVRAVWESLHSTALQV